MQAIHVVLNVTNRSPRKSVDVIDHDCNGPKALGLSGGYALTRIDSRTGKPAPCGATTGTLTTTRLPQWGIEGYLLRKGTGTAQ